MGSLSASIVIIAITPIIAIIALIAIIAIIPIIPIILPAASAATAAAGSLQLQPRRCSAADCAKHTELGAYFKALFRKLWKTYAQRTKQRRNTELIRPVLDPHETKPRTKRHRG